MKTFLTTLTGAILLLCLALQACGVPHATTVSPIQSQPTESIEPIEPTEATPVPVAVTDTPIQVLTPTAIQHITKPGTPTYIEDQKINDCNLGETYKPDHPLALLKNCDNWLNNLLERPFTSDLNTYLPYLDIIQTQFGANRDWFFARIRLFDVVPSKADGDVNYIIESDLNFDGLSDMLIVVQNLPPDAFIWTVDDIRAWRYVDGNVNLVYDQGVGTDPDLIWVRRTPKAIEISFKPALFDNDLTFAWWVWAYQGKLDPTQLIPLDTLPDIYQVDDTCALGFNYNIMTTGLINKCIR
jgi:hypothetical protein